MQYDSLGARRRRLERIGSVQEAADDAIHHLLRKQPRCRVLLGCESRFVRAEQIAKLSAQPRIVSTGYHGIVVTPHNAAYSQLPSISSTAQQSLRLAVC